MSIRETRRALILMVDDNPGYVAFTREAFREAGVQADFQIAGDGETALQMLLGQGEFERPLMPDLVLLDLNMPRLHGSEVLATIKSHESLKHIPVIILSSSRARIDILQSYQRYANSYIVKPVELADFTEVVRSLDSYWDRIVSLPTERYCT